MPTQELTTTRRRGRRRVPAERDGVTWRNHIDAFCSSHRFDECRIEFAIFDHPRQRPLAQLISRELDRASVVAANVHRFDRGDTIGRQFLPHAETMQKRSAPGLIA